MWRRIDKFELISKANSHQSSLSGGANMRDHIDHDSWDKGKLDALLGLHGKAPASADGEEEPKAKKKEEHPLVKYIKYQVSSSLFNHLSFFLIPQRPL